MELPKNKRALDEIFKNAESLDPSELSGEYFVDMLTGLPSLKRFNHRKIFRQENGQTIGCNIIFKNKKWGCFFLEQTAGLKEGDAKTTINYDTPQNSLITKRIRDCIKKIGDNLYLGRFNYILFGKPRFLGYFSLTKK
ncbi:MAG: hypothetical protein GXP44_00650 [bacterium]|nr:hypothetical protein [bacterium]